MVDERLLVGLSMGCASCEILSSVVFTHSTHKFSRNMYAVLDNFLESTNVIDI